MREVKDITAMSVDERIAYAKANSPLTEEELQMIKEGSALTTPGSSKCPSMSVVTALVVPSIATVTPIMGSWSPLLTQAADGSFAEEECIEERIYQGRCAAHPF